MKNEYKKEAIRLLGRVGFTELISVLEGVKQAMRIACLGKEAREIRELIREIGLSIEQSSYAIKDDVSHCNIAHTCHILPQEPVEDSDRRFIYIGVDEIAVKLASTFDFVDDLRFGLVLGYPRCCIEFFCNHYSRDNFDLIFNVNKPAKSQYDPLLNIACKTMDYRLISHFPCHWDCEESHELAEATLKAKQACNVNYVYVDCECFTRIMRGVLPIY
jgi:hypothetical protein